MSTPPRWDLSNVYPSLEAKELAAAIKEYKAQVASFGKFFDTKLAKAGPKTPISKLAPLAGEAVERANRIYILSGTIVPYIYSFVSTDSHNKLAKKTMWADHQALRRPGGGKIPVLPKYVQSISEDEVVMRNFQGETFVYPQVKTGKPKSKRRERPVMMVSENSSAT